MMMKEKFRETDQLKTWLDSFRPLDAIVVEDVEK